VTSSKVHLHSYIGTLDDLTEKAWLPDGPGVGSAQPWIPNRPEVNPEEPRIRNWPGGSWEVFGARVACTWLFVSH